MTIGAYSYDPVGRRAEKTASGATTEYAYAKNDVIAEYDGTGTLLRRIVPGGAIDAPIAFYDEDAPNDPIFYLHYDGQGSVIGVSDSTGANTEKYTYGPFGETPDDTGSPYHYVARRIDQETGLYYVRARYYSPEVGRFLSPDPIGYGDGLNMYAYVRNDPVNFRDPSGASRIKDNPDAHADDVIGSGNAGDGEGGGKSASSRCHSCNVRVLTNFDRRGGNGASPNYGSGVGDNIDQIIVIGASTGSIFGSINRFFGSSPLLNRTSGRIGSSGPGLNFNITPALSGTSGADAQSNGGIGGFLLGVGQAVVQAAYDAFIANDSGPFTTGLGVLWGAEPGPIFAPSGNGVNAAGRTAGSLTLLAGGVAIGARTAVSAGTPNRIFSARVLARSAEEPGPFHNFPSSFDSAIFSGSRLNLSPNYTLYSLRGVINGRTGAFEIGVRPSASGRTQVITHRFFNPD